MQFPLFSVNRRQCLEFRSKARNIDLLQLLASCLFHSDRRLNIDTESGIRDQVCKFLTSLSVLCSFIFIRTQYSSDVWTSRKISQCVCAGPVVIRAVSIRASQFATTTATMRSGKTAIAAHIITFITEKRLFQVYVDVIHAAVSRPKTACENYTCDHKFCALCSPASSPIASWTQVIILRTTTQSPVADSNTDIDSTATVPEALLTACFLNSPIPLLLWCNTSGASTVEISIV